MARPIQSVQRAFRLLEILASKAEPCGVRALARMTDLTPPTTLSLLQTMLEGGYVHYDSPSRLYGIGHGIYVDVVNVDESGIAALGMPILSADRRARFAIGLSAPLHRYNADRKEIWLAHLQETAASLVPILH